jgi:hypothetical protein
VEARRPERKVTPRFAAVTHLFPFDRFAGFRIPNVSLDAGSLGLE